MIYLWFGRIDDCQEQNGGRQDRRVPDQHLGVFCNKK